MAGIIDGIPALRARLVAIKAKKIAALAAALVEAGKYLLRESMALVPVDIGNLKATGYVRLAYSIFTRMPIVYVGYSASYAIYVHENMDALHGHAFNTAYARQIAAYAALSKREKRRRGDAATNPFRHERGPDQQAKFLEKPYRERRREMMAIIKDRMS